MDDKGLTNNKISNIFKELDMHALNDALMWMRQKRCARRIAARRCVFAYQTGI